MGQHALIIPPLDKQAGESALRYIDTLTKPHGSLGRLEELAIELAEMTANPFPDVTPPGIVIFAADHGIVKEGVSAYPQEVTAQMVLNFCRGGAAINVFARQIGALLQVVDVGVASNLDAPGAVLRKVRYGTGNFLCEDAMSRKEAEMCIEAGREAARVLANQGAKLLIVGEMGIGNTSASSAVLAALTGDQLEVVVGRGTGISNEALLHKQNTIRLALQNRQPDADDPLDVLSKVGGLEIGAMAGAILEAASMRLPVLVDGFISSVSALLASRIDKRASDYLIIGHQSQERGHRQVLQVLGKTPLVDLQLRLGEGTGAALAYPIVRAASRMINEMATFQSAGISEKSE